MTVSNLMPRSAAACGLGLLAASCFADPGPSAEAAVAEVTVAEVSAPEPLTEAPPTESRRWSSAREAYDGPVLDAEWFAKRRVVVYLVPNGGLPAMRGPAAAVIRDHWTEGDWSLKHVFVSSVPSKAIFIAGRRIGLYDLASGVTKEAGQGDDFVAANEDYVQQNVFFVHDPEGTAWAELLGAEFEDHRLSAAVLLENGRVVKSIEVKKFGFDTAEDAAERETFAAGLASEVRETLPSRP